MAITLASKRYTIAASGSRIDSRYPSGGAFDFYISATGSDSDAGTIDAPWAITALASKAAIENRVVGLLDGTYVAQNATFNTNAINVGYACTVQAVNPRLAIISGYNGSSYSEQGIIGTHVDGVTFKNLKVEKGTYKLMWVDGDNCTITGCDLGDLDVRRDGTPTYTDNTECIRIENLTTRITDTLIENCYLHDVLNTSDGDNTNENAAGIKTYGSEGLIVRNCTFKNVGDGVYLKKDTAGATVEYCFFNDVSRVCVGGIGGDEDWTAGTRTAYSNVIRYNVAINASQFVDAGNTATAPNLAQPTAVHNNTAVMATGSVAAILSRAGTDGLFTVYNNVITCASWGSYGGLYFIDALDVALCDFNLVSSWKARAGASTYISLATWQGAVTFDDNSTATAPTFVNGSGTAPADYALASGAGVDAGKVGGVIGGATVNMGAYASGSESIGKDW